MNFFADNDEKTDIGAGIFDWINMDDDLTVPNKLHTQLPYQMLKLIQVGFVIRL